MYRKFQEITNSHELSYLEVDLKFNEPENCPMCKTSILAIFLKGYFTWPDAVAIMLCPACNKPFVKSFIVDEHKNEKLQYYLAPDIPNVSAFTKDIQNLSSNFITVYNQAEQAEEYGLDEICGMGYRKALEFLIKDYILLNIQDETEKEKIKKKHLGLCIEQDIDNVKIKEIAKRATWLGNDEAHYLNYHNEEIDYLKKLINVVVRWIDDELTSEKALNEIKKLP